MYYFLLVNNINCFWYFYIYDTTQNKRKCVKHEEVNEKIKKKVMLGKDKIPLHCKISFTFYLYQGKNINIYTIICVHITFFKLQIKNYIYWALVLSGLEILHKVFYFEKQ